MQEMTDTEEATITEIEINQPDKDLDLKTISGMMEMQMIFLGNYRKSLKETSPLIKSYF